MARGHVLDASERLTQRRALPHRDQAVTRRHRSEPALDGFAPVGRPTSLPRAAAVLHLQRIHGNRATMRMIARRVSPPDVGLVAPVPVVQRYVETGAADYADLPANRPARGGGNEPTFMAQQMTVDARKPVVAPLQQPNLKVADTGMMAIAAAPQPKEFYADQSVIDASNSKLEGVDSPLRLVDTGRPLTIRVPGARQTKQLMKVQPTSSDQRGLAALSDKCNEIAADVMGKTNRTQQQAEAIFVGTGNTSVKTKTLDFHGGSYAESPNRATAGPAHVAEFLADNAGKSVTPTDLESNLTAGEGTMPAKETPKKYGRANPAQLRQRGKELGVNESAMPDVGEAFGTIGVRSGPDEPSLDYSKETATDRMWLAAAEQANALKVRLGRMTAEEAAAALEEYSRKFAHYLTNSWTWHFAGVVARSGGDAVTLENYNRNDELQKAYITAYQEAERQNKQRIAELAQAEDFGEDIKPGDRSIERLIKEAPGLVAYGVQLLNTELVRAGKAAIVQQPQPNSLWFFQMYGAKAGQSFHEAMAKSGDFTNPLTIRWRDPLTDEFRTKRKDQLDAEAEELRKRHPQGAAKGALKDLLPPLLQKAKTAIDQAETKSDVSEIWRKTIDRMKRIDNDLSKLK